ncbi:hypothetical protein BKG79_22465 [Mycobacteroides chelonae]|nr:hypothetical protein BKG79_22465 [Mycobacteroides chelonae]
MNLSLLVLYVPEPTLDRAAKFYGAILDAEPVREQHGEGRVHWSVTRGGLTIELYPMRSGLPTRSRFEFMGDVDAAVERLIERAYALPERTRDGAGWWLHDPCGNTVVLLRAE